MFASKLKREPVYRMSKLLFILILSVLVPGELTSSYETEDDDLYFDVAQDGEGDSEEALDDEPELDTDLNTDTGRDLYVEDDRDDEADYEEEIVYSKHPNPRNSTLAGAVTRRYKPLLLQRSTRSTLECYSCTYSRGQALKACLDPIKYKVSVIRCHSTDDRCYTSVQGESAERLRMLVRGCRSNCFSSALWSCCADNKCNKVPYTEPTEAPPPERVGRAARALRRAAEAAGAAGAANPPAPPPPAPLVFVGILLLLQTVLKVILP